MPPQPSAPYTEMDPEEAPAKMRCKRCMKYSGKICGAIFLVYVLVVVLVQAALYEWATMHCKPGDLQDYGFPGGATTGNRTAAENLVPEQSLVIEQDPRWWGSSFVNFPSNADGLFEGASTGVYYRTWGPLFWTMTYQDTMSKETFVARDRPLALGGSHKIYRCDGTGPSYVVTEGTHVFMNAIREWFGMYTSRVYNIYQDSVLVAVSAKVGGSGQSHKQMVFREPDKDSPFASAFLKDRDYHGRFDEWFVQVDKNSPLPNFVPTAVAAMAAFATGALKNHTGAPGQMLELLDEFPTESPSGVEAPVRYV